MVTLKIYDLGQDELLDKSAMSGLAGGKQSGLSPDFSMFMELSGLLPGFDNATRMGTFNRVTQNAIALNVAVNNNGTLNQHIRQGQSALVTGSLQIA